MSDSEQRQKIPATLIPGDGIGPEITHAVVEILDTLGAPFAWDEQIGGMAGIENGGDPLPQATLDSIKRTKLALKGPLTTPVGVASAPSTSACGRPSGSMPTCGPRAPWSRGAVSKT